MCGVANGEISFICQRLTLIAKGTERKSYALNQNCMNVELTVLVCCWRREFSSHTVRVRALHLIEDWWTELISFHEKIKLSIKILAC